MLLDWSIVALQDWCMALKSYKKDTVVVLCGPVCAERFLSAVEIQVFCFFAEGEKLEYPEKSNWSKQTNKKSSWNLHKPGSMIWTSPTGWRLGHHHHCIIFASELSGHLTTTQFFFWAKVFFFFFYLIIVVPIASIKMRK